MMATSFREHFAARKQSQFCEIHPAYRQEIANLDRPITIARKPLWPQIRERLPRALVTINVTAATLFCAAALLANKAVTQEPAQAVAPSVLPEVSEKISQLDDQVKDVVSVLNVLVPKVKEATARNGVVREIGKVSVARANLREGPGLEFPSTLAVEWSSPHFIEWVSSYF